jgi:hypothetical protein
LKKFQNINQNQNSNQNIETRKEKCFEEGKIGNRPKLPTQPTRAQGTSPQNFSLIRT